MDTATPLNIPPVPPDLLHGPSRGLPANARISLSTQIPRLEKITRMIRAVLGVDAAVFDVESRLLACTEDYLAHKGKRVHAPSIQEVVANGNVMVNKPGHMRACAGCRFLGNCPAKIEILRSIRNGTTPLGVITLTSFTQRGP